MAAHVHLPERPPGRPRVSFRWHDLLFMHWPVSPDRIRSLLPERLEVQTFEGRAWIGLVPFTMSHIRRLPLPPIPGTSRFHECNVRTYVTCHGRPGVYFFSLDASHGIACAFARRYWHLNYIHSAIQAQHERRRYVYHLGRVREPAITLHCEWWRGGRRATSEPGSLDHFLTERYAMFAADRAGRIWEGRIWHHPWPLRNAELIELEDTLLRASGIEIDRAEQPVLHHCDELQAEAWPLTLVATDR